MDDCLSPIRNVFYNRDRIPCRTCVNGRRINSASKDEEIPTETTKGFCEAYNGPEAEMPYKVVFLNEGCPRYKRDAAF